MDYKENSFNVLTHGDFWASNVMLSFDQDQTTIKESIFVDYQICKWGSPAEDLLFFITLSTAKELRIKEFDNFIAIYHKRLVECLKLLKFNKHIPTLRELHCSLYHPNVSFYGKYHQF